MQNLLLGAKQILAIGPFVSKDWRTAQNVAEKANIVNKYTFCVWEKKKSKVHPRRDDAFPNC